MLPTRRPTTPGQPVVLRCPVLITMVLFLMGSPALESDGRKKSDHQIARSRSHVIKSSLLLYQFLYIHTHTHIQTTLQNRTQTIRQKGQFSTLLPHRTMFISCLSVFLWVPSSGRLPPTFIACIQFSLSLFVCTLVGKIHISLSTCRKAASLCFESCSNL